jgi:hypothetical protein
MKREWRGDKARPANRAKTWGRKVRDPRKERREGKRVLKGARFSLIVLGRGRRASKSVLELSTSGKVWGGKDLQLF